MGKVGKFQDCVEQNYNTHTLTHSINMMPCLIIMDTHTNTMYHRSGNFHLKNVSHRAIFVAKDDIARAELVNRRARPQAPSYHRK